MCIDTRKPLPQDTETDGERVKALTNEEIKAAVREDPEAAPIADEAEVWKRVVLRWPPAKRHISRRLDYDIYCGLKECAHQQGKGYQTLINAILRSYREAHTRTNQHKQ